MQFNTHPSISRQVPKMQKFGSVKLNVPTSKILNFIVSPPSIYILIVLLLYD